MAEEQEGDLDAFLDKFRGPQRYEGAFSPDSWEQEFEKIPMFMKETPSEIDSEQHPDLACLQSIIFDEEQTPEAQATTYKNEGNSYFKEKDYKKAVISYTEGLKKCSDQDLNVVLLTNRAAAQFYLGNCRSALNDVIAARKLKPDHLKAIVRGALCHLELRHYHEALTWCDEGLKIDPKDKKLLEMRIKADRLKRTEERDLRKAKLQEKKELSQKEALLKAIRDRNIKLSLESSKDKDDKIISDLAEMSLDGFTSENTTGAKVSLDENGCLIWPVLFLYPEHGQTDFIAAFHEESRFIDHLMVMFEELTPWDVEKKYIPSELELYYEDEERAEFYQIDTQATLLEALQQQRYFVKTGTPTFLVLVKHSPFSKNYFLGKKVHRL